MKKVLLSCLLGLSLCLVLGMVLTTGPVQAEIGTAAGGPILGGGQCGTAFCGPGTFCCNRSCSICAPIGGACTQQVCPPVE